MHIYIFVYVDVIVLLDIRVCAAWFRVHIIINLLEVVTCACSSITLHSFFLFFFEKKIYFHIRKNQQKNTTNKTMYKRQSKEKTIE